MSPTARSIKKLAGSVSKVEMEAPMALTYKVLFSSTRESKVPESRHTNLIEPHWKGQEINAARQFNA